MLYLSRHANLLGNIVTTGIDLREREWAIDEARAQGKPPSNDLHDDQPF